MIISAVFAIAVTGCGDTSASESAGAGDSSGAASARQADEQAEPYVGTWKAEKLTLVTKTTKGDKETDLDIPVSVELDGDMTGKVTIGDSSQDVEWEVRTWESLKIERAVITLHEPFEIKGIICDPDNLLLEFSDSDASAQLFNHWTSKAQSGVKLGVETMVEKLA